MKFIVIVRNIRKTQHLIEADSFKEAEYQAIAEHNENEGLSLGFEIKHETTKIAEPHIGL